jgi:monoterpene epsilon-lactone hydrolase
MPSISGNSPTRESWLRVHPLTAHDRAIVAELRASVEPFKGKLRGVEARAPFDAAMDSVLAPQGVQFRADRVGGIPGWWCEPPDALRGTAILHLHGGWFNLGSALAYRHLVGHLARSAGIAAFIPDYRLAPEHPFPAAVDDATAAFHGIAQRDIRRIAITGDSAGGGLAMNLLLRLMADTAKVELPLGVVLHSPITDLAMTGGSWRSRAEADWYFSQEQAAGLIQAYLNGHSPLDSLASPLYANLAGAPPLRVLVGDDEVLLDDSVRLVENAVAAGVDAQLDIWEGMPHGFLGSIGRTEAAESALGAIGEFLFCTLSGASTNLGTK